jgi:hypothetical protein
MTTFSAIAVSHDGERFLLAVPPMGALQARVGVVTDWTAGLTK